MRWSDGRCDGTRVEVVAGGATRQDSELCGLRHLAARIAADEIDTVLVHDGARPLVTAELVAAVLAAARADGGAVPGLRRDDLAVATTDGAVRWPPDAGASSSPCRPRRASARSPCSRRTSRPTGGLRRHRHGVMRAALHGPPVRWVAGEERNFKITYAHDLVLAEHAAARR